MLRSSFSWDGCSGRERQAWKRQEIQQVQRGRTTGEDGRNSIVRNISAGWDIAGLCITLTLMLIEGYLTFSLELQRHNSMYLFLPLVMYFLFRLLLSVPGHAPGWTRDVSMIVYVIHPGVLIVLRGIAGAAAWTGSLWKMHLSSLSVFRQYLLLPLYLSIWGSPASGCGRRRVEMHETDRAWISIDKENLLHNVKELRRLSGAGCALMPAVKANAYGHGDVLVCRILQDAGIRDYCVASVDEGIRLRQAGISGQILILGYTHPDGFAELMHYRLTQTAVDLDCAGRLSVYAGKVNCGRTAGNRDTIAVHVGVDTGMHRLGIPYDRTDLIEKVWGLPDLRVTGLFSHLCVSDGLTDAEEKYTREQIQRFDQAADYLHKKSIRGFKCHIQGSYGLLTYPEYLMTFPGRGLPSTDA